MATPGLTGPRILRLTARVWALERIVEEQEKRIGVLEEQYAHILQTLKRHFEELPQAEEEETP